jgi:hypothetical protein
VRARWLETLEREPSVYLRTRLSSFGSLMRLKEPPFFYWQPGTSKNDLGVTQSPNLFTRMLEAGVLVTARRAPILMKPYFWALLAIVLITVAAARKGSDGQPLALALLTSAALYTFAYLPITASADFRYVYWSVMATNVAMAILLVGGSPENSTEPSHRRKAHSFKQP